MVIDLDQFRAAQQPVYERVLGELRAGRKRSHWMWFIFPQLAGLGRSAMAARYAIGSLVDARAYLADPVLGARLRECTAVVAGLTVDPVAVFGPVDAVKLRSSVTLFLRADPAEEVFTEVLHRHFAGEPDPATDALL